MSFRARLWGLAPSKAATQANAGPRLQDGASKAAESSRAPEMSDLEDAMAAAEHIMNDDIEGAEARLRDRHDTSSFHQLGLGVSKFMRSILGFEKEIMAEATARLADCEKRAISDLKAAQKAAGLGGSYWYGRGSSNRQDEPRNSVYPPGSEFALVHAEAQLMNAVVGVMHETLTEGIKGFYKLRKAFITLEGIMAAEAEFLASWRLGQSPAGLAESTAANLRPQTLPTSDTRMNGYEGESTSDSDDDDSSQFFDAAEDMAPKAHSSPASPITPPTDDEQTTKASSLATTALKTPVDIFIHSGANMCYGIMLLVISMVPPAFSRLMYAVGFKGDRDRGVRMLWQSTKFANINGAVAGLVLLAYFNGLLAFADILPLDADIQSAAAAKDDDGEDGEDAAPVVGYPRDRCAALLADMRRRYPQSRLWRLEEARVLANGRRLEEAIALLRDSTDSTMRQINALTSFELSLNAMYAQDWMLMRDQFLRCIELNDWSNAIYYYMAGCAELEMYRDARQKITQSSGTAEASGGSSGNEVHDESEGERDYHQRMMTRHKAAAEDYFRKVPQVAGRKRFMARQMPFEVFVCRRVAKFEFRAAALGVDLADAVGISPAIEMTYLWNGIKKMTTPQLERVNTRLAWERCTAPREVMERIQEEKDEAAAMAVCQAAILRELGNTKRARDLLAPLLAVERALYRSATANDYVLPAAHYEMAVVTWVEASVPGMSDEERRPLIDECHAHLDIVSRWESFVLDARFGLRFKAGVDSVKWLKQWKRWG